MENPPDMQELQLCTTCTALLIQRVPHLHGKRSLLACSSAREREQITFQKQQRRREEYFYNRRFPHKGLERINDATSVDVDSKESTLPCTNTKMGTPAINHIMRKRPKIIPVLLTICQTSHNGLHYSVFLSSQHQEIPDARACFCRSLLRTSVASKPALSHSCLGITCPHPHIHAIVTPTISGV